MFGDCSGKRNENHHGMLGMVAANVLSQLSEHTVCTLSILEIVDEDVLKDLLVVRGRTTSSVTIRHVDQRGAVVHGLSDMPLDSMTGLNVSDNVDSDLVCMVVVIIICISSNFSRFST